MSAEAGSSRRSPVQDGRLRLATERRRAEALLSAARDGEPEALERVARRFPGTAAGAIETPEAESVIAAEAGFESWAALAAHVEALDQAAGQAGRDGDGDLSTLHLRCGSDIQEGLRQVGLTGEFLEFSDPYCMGPVPALPTPELIRRRAAFLSSQPGLAGAGVLARLQQQYAALESLDRFERVVLWFEHDSHDQLILAYLLHRLADRQPGCHLELVAVDQVPGVGRFIGLGQLAPDVLAWLWSRRKPVDEELLKLGSEAWEAITAPTPRPLAQLARRGTPALPMMSRALQRHLQELPAVDTGLGYSEQQTLEIVRDEGPLSLGKVFGHLMRFREPLPYLGDLMFWWLVQPLLTSPTPLLRYTDNAHADWPNRVVATTEQGAGVLNGEPNWLDLYPPERWVGGVKVPDEGHAWCYDQRGFEVTARPVP